MKHLLLRLISLLLLVVAVSVPLFTLSAQGQPTPQALEGRSRTPEELRIEALVKKVVEEGKTVDQLTEEYLADLPVGIARKIGETTYIIAIDSAYSDERGWFLSAYASLTLPNSTQPLAFAARNIAFHQGGISATSQTRLVLVTPQTIPMQELTLVLPADGHNYVEFDCSGFRAINLKGEFLLPQDQVQSALAVATPPSIQPLAALERVKATFEINTSDLNNILTSVSITPFKIKGLDDFSFSVKNAVLDMSDIANPPGFSFPAGYQQSFGADIDLWRGFYLQEIAIVFSGLDSSKSENPAFQARNMLIDNLGVSGLFTATHLLSMEEGGAADGWPLSVDRLSVKLEHNHLVGGGLAGAIRIPFLGEDTLGYAADMEQVDGKLTYRFSVITRSEKSFSIPLAGKVYLDPGSTITMEKKNGKLIPSAMLNGRMDIANNKFSASGIKFERLGLTTQKPYIVSGVFAVTDNKPASTAGFQIRIDQLSLEVFSGQVALGAAVSLAMMNTEDKGFSASTSIKVLANMQEKPVGTGEMVRNVQTWKLDKIKVEDILLNCQTAAFGLKGRLTLFDQDPIYGNGFRGSLNFSLKKVFDPGIKASAYFGSKDAYKYWHLDVYVPTGNIPLVPPISLNGVVGGISYHMVRKQAFTPDFNKLNVEVDESQSLPQANAASEVVFLPDSTAGLAFMAGITLVAASDKAFNADAVLEVAFNKGGGLRYIQFNGSGYFFSPVKSRRGGTSKAPVYASLNMLFDNNNDVFHANMQTYINLAGTIKGTGPGGLVGEAVIHVDRKDWYIYIGRPSQMNGISMAGLGVLQSYFMVGSKIENLALPPAQVREVFDDIDLDFMRDENATRNGRGFAVGVRFQAGFDSKDKLNPFYAILQLGAGADVMLRDYGSEAACEGRGGSLGMNGWYASGQAYVFLVGRVGLEVKGKKFDILSLGAAALLQAKLPNPTWMQGAIGGKYAILGGLVKGKFNLKFTVGEECQLMNRGNELGDIEIIADLKPSKDGKEVSVFTAPQVSFNSPIGKEIKLTTNENEVNSYRIVLDDCRVVKGAETIQAKLEWNKEADVVLLRTAEILPPQAALKLTVKLHWEKKVANGGWEPVKDKGQIAYEMKEAGFTTGAAPDFIPEDNVAYSYPVKHQYHFHKDEYGKGYVKLNVPQGYLFQEKDSLGSWRFLARFQAIGGKALETPLTYDRGQGAVHFDLPIGLTVETVYRMNVIKVPTAAATVDGNLKRESKEITGTDPENTATVRANRLEGNVVQHVEKEIYTSAFRTSKFNTFADKMANFQQGQDVFDIESNLAILGKRVASSETFDTFELVGNEKNVGALVQVVASAENTWYKETQYPLLYELYGQDAAVTISDWRNAEVVGTPPMKAVKLFSNNSREGYMLTDAHINSGYAATQSGTSVVEYYLSYYSYFDYEELRGKAATKYLRNGQGPTSITRLLSATGYTDLLEGKYPILFRYTLPGINQVTKEVRVDVKF